MNFNSVICLYNILILQKIEKYRFGKIGTQIGTDVTDPRFQARRDWSISKKKKKTLNIHSYSINKL